MLLLQNRLIKRSSAILRLFSVRFPTSDKKGRRGDSERGGAVHGIIIAWSSSHVYVRPLPLQNYLEVTFKKRIP